MELTEVDIREFQGLWKKEFGETLAETDARTRGSQLLELYARLAEPLPHDRVKVNNNEAPQ